MGVKLAGQEILQVLAEANEAALQEPLSPAEQALSGAWKPRIEALQREEIPRTYLAVTGVLLTARSLRSRDELDVRAIQSGSDPRGYSASSIAGKLAAFAKEHGIDLRAGSTQPMNNQPFTFKKRITDDMGVQAKYADAWHGFLDTVDAIDTLDPDEARTVLALLFRAARMSAAAALPQVHVASRGRAVLTWTADAVAELVGSRSDNGKVGQAFVAALLDLLYGPDQVLLGDTQDPDASTPGDVHASDEHGVWLWAEAKQKVIQTGDITGFLKKVHSAGGERVAYFALRNNSYSGYVQPVTITAEADRLDIHVQYLDSPEAAMDWLLPLAPGNHATVAANLLQRLGERLVQAGCSSATLDAYQSIVAGAAAGRLGNPDAARRRGPVSVAQQRIGPLEAEESS